MINDTLADLLDANQRHVESGDVPTTAGDEPITTLVVSCTMAPQAPQHLWPRRPTDHSATVTMLGNQVRERADGDVVLDANLAHLIHSQEIETILVVGHTDCEIIAKTYEEYIIPDKPVAASIKPQIEPLLPIVREAIDSGTVSTDRPQETVRHQLVEYNVARQVDFLAAHESVSATVAGYVYDTEGVYGSFPDTYYLVSLDGERDVEALRSRVPDDSDVAVASLLD